MLKKIFTAGLLALFIGASVAPSSGKATEAPPSPPLRGLHHTSNDIHVVHFLMDGLKYSALQKAAEKNLIPHLKEYFQDHGVTFEKTYNTFPSISSSGYVAFTTGLGTGNSGVFFLEWMDRTNKKVVDYLSLKGYKQVNADLFNRLDLLNPKKEGLQNPTTLFEILSPLPTAAIYSSFYKGATGTLPKPLPFAGLWHATVTKDGFRLNEMAMDELNKLFAKPTDQLPRYTFVGMVSTDYLGHKFGSESEEIELSLKEFDGMFAHFVESLRQKGIQDKTYIILSSDHGMHDTGNLLDLKKMLGEKGLKFNKHYYITHRGVSSAFVYLFQDSPLKSVPVTKNKSIHMISALTSIEAIDWVAFRDGLDKVRIATSEGSGLISKITVAEQNFYHYSYQGKDPLGYNKPPTLLNDRAWLEATYETARPNAVPLVADLFQDPKVGDILIVAKNAWGFRSAKAATHGSLTQEDMHIPLWIAGPHLSQVSNTPHLGVDIFPTILEWFGIEDTFDHEGSSLFAKEKRHPTPEQQMLATLEQYAIHNPALYKTPNWENQLRPLLHSLNAAQRHNLEELIRQEISDRLAQYKKLSHLLSLASQKQNPLRFNKKETKNKKWQLERETTNAFIRTQRAEPLLKLFQ